MEKVPDSKKYTITQAAKLLDVCRTTVYNHAKNGLLRIGSRKVTKRPFVYGKYINKLNE